MYNELSAKYLADFLPSLEAALRFLPPHDYKVYGFDNSFSDFTDNRKLIEEKAKNLNLEYKTLGINLGFGRAYNILIREAIKGGAEYFLILNPDMILEEVAIKRLVEAMDSDVNLAAVSPKIKQWDFLNHAKTNTIDSVGLILRPGLQFNDLGQGEEDKGQFDKTEIIGPSGAAGLWRLNFLKKIAEQPVGSLESEYFDERFFMYKEDCDLAYRLFVNGGIARLISDAIFYHDRTAMARGESLFAKLNNRKNKSRQIRAWSFRNQHLIFVKHWKKQNLTNKLIIIFRSLSFLIFSLILEKFLLKEYLLIFRSRKILTNTK